jgi:hypothetical protein
MLIYSRTLNNKMLSLKPVLGWGRGLEDEEISFHFPVLFIYRFNQTEPEKIAVFVVLFVSLYLRMPY